MNCLVLGGAGFIGSHLVDALLAHGHRVRVYDRLNIDKRNLAQVLPNIEFLGGDFLDESCTIKALDEIDVVYHLISTTIPGSSNNNPIYDIESNLVGTVKWLTVARNSGVKQIVFTSSGGAIYGAPTIAPIPEAHPTNPICSYGITKLAIEKYLHLFYHLYGLDYTVLRIANLYGERQNPHSGLGAITNFLWHAIKHKPITIWGDGSVARDYVYISDLVSALLRVIEDEAPSRIYNIGRGIPVTLNEIVDRIGYVTGLELEVNYTPGRKFDVPVNCLDVSLARKELDWSPKVRLEEGIDRTFSWLKSA